MIIVKTYEYCKLFTVREKEAFCPNNGAVQKIELFKYLSIIQWAPRQQSSRD